MTLRRPTVRQRLPVDTTLKGIVVLFRLLGWAWMLLLVILTPIGDPAANNAITFGAMGLATVWTAATVWAARTADHLGRAWFVVGDLTIALIVGFASTAAGAQDLFHGGYPISSLAVIAFATNMRITIWASLVVGFEQVVVHFVDDRGGIPAAGSVVFLVFGTLLGWSFEALRDQERRRLEVQADLDRAEAARVRHEERLDLANRLHDSVLQTLTALRRDAEDPNQVRYLARRQERLLRRTISEYRSEYEHSARAEIQGMCDEIEDVHRVEIDTVVRGDVAVDPTIETLLAAAREALTNAAKHSGADIIDLYAELEPGRIEVFVRDRGHGFDAASSSSGRGIDHGLVNRIAGIDGEAKITSEVGVGTSVELRWPAP
jgi:signal transduction histidine kinase